MAKRFENVSTKAIGFIREVVADENGNKTTVETPFEIELGFYTRTTEKAEKALNKTAKKGQRYLVDELVNPEIETTQYDNSRLYAFASDIADDEVTANGIKDAYDDAHTVKRIEMWHYAGFVWMRSVEPCDTTIDPNGINHDVHGFTCQFIESESPNNFTKVDMRSHIKTTADETVDGYKSLDVVDEYKFRTFRWVVIADDVLPKCIKAKKPNKNELLP